VVDEALTRASVGLDAATTPEYTSGMRHQLLGRASPLALRATLAASMAILLATTACTTDVVLPSSSGGGSGPSLAAGEICVTPSAEDVQVRAEPSVVFVTPCDGDPTACVVREVDVVVDPDFCESQPVTFESDAPSVVAAPADSAVGLKKPSLPLEIRGGADVGTANIAIRVPKGDGTDAMTTLRVEVLAPGLPECDGTAAFDALMGGDQLLGEDGLAGASIGLPEGASAPNAGSYLWSVAPFSADMICGDDIVPAGYRALGPAITFGPTDQVFQREVPVSVPINPAMLPSEARLRHLRLAYSGPAFKEPRTVPVADPHIEMVGGQWAVTFKVPRLGTYQAVVKRQAGQRQQRRRLTHRAIIGVSMGGLGASMVGMRHHHLFDVVASLGGPATFTWLQNHIERNHHGGFPAIAPGTTLDQIQISKTTCAEDDECPEGETCLGILSDAPGRCTRLPEPLSPYEHTQTFNNWWAEHPSTGSGGTFPRAEYAQMFRDLSLMFGNPNGDNLTRGAEYLPAGVRFDDPSQLGDHAASQCAVWVDPLDDDPDAGTQQEIADSCPVERCSHTLTLTGYYDDEYNPDGTFPVITVCDGTPTNEDLTPYANTWRAGDFNDQPLEVALAVDYNGNGVRDEMEPIIRAGHEPWDDYGVDAMPSELEVGYALGENDDPAGDDYEAQYNPTGTERDWRHQPDEAFLDYGLDGVANTPQQPAWPVGWEKPGDGYDVGESDGQFTASRGLKRMWDADPTNIARQLVTDIPGGPFDDDALSRLDVWTDGGSRDFFNFHVSAAQMAGAFVARDRDVVYLTDFAQAPGLEGSESTELLPARIVYDDLQGVVMQRYGALDPTSEDIDSGSGQHVGTALEITSRVQSALYFIGSRWKDPELRTQLEAVTSENLAEGGPDCWLTGRCVFDFEASDGRSGPVTISLPPGYGHKDLQERRYPVIYMLHGYNQTPDDLAATIELLDDWMNSASDSSASRLPKAILVYVDGRCRVGDDGEAECIRGTFYANSPREGGVQSETWWLELMDYVDQNYRTMGEEEVGWTE